MARVTTKVKELKAYVKGQERQIANQQKAMQNMHETITEDINTIAKLESTKQYYISVIAYLEFKLEQKNGE